MTPIFSKLTGFALLVATISTLSASDAGHLEEGAQGWVGSQRSTWSLVKNARAGTTADGQNIVAATGAGANAFWVRQTSTDHYWAYQLGWFIDPSAGNDENVGSTSGTALKTVAELTRRLSIVLQGTNYTFDLLGNIPSTDRLNWTPIFVGPAPAVTVFAQRGTLLFRGVQTVSRSGTLSAAAQTNTTTQASAADGATVWTADIGKLLVMTGNTISLSSCCITSTNGTAAAPQQIQLSQTISPAFATLGACLFLNFQVEVLAGAQFRVSNTLFQGTRAQLANSGQNSAQSGYAIFLGNCGFFDWDRNAAANGRDAAISVEGGGFVGINGFVFGTTAIANTYGVRVEAGGQLMIASQGGVAGITVAGAAAAIRFDDPGVGAAVGTAIPPLVVGAVTPAVQPLTTWANFNAAPFNSYVMSYRNGARIYING